MQYVLLTDNNVNPNIVLYLLVIRKLFRFNNVNNLIKNYVFFSARSDFMFTSTVITDNNMALLISNYDLC